MEKEEMKEPREWLFKDDRNGMLEEFDEVRGESPSLESVKRETGHGREVGEVGHHRSPLRGFSGARTAGNKTLKAHYLFAEGKKSFD